MGMVIGMKKRQSLNRKYSMKLGRLWTEKDLSFMRESHKWCAWSGNISLSSGQLKNAESKRTNLKDVSPAYRATRNTRAFKRVKYYVKFSIFVQLEVMVTLMRT